MNPLLIAIFGVAALSVMDAIVKGLVSRLPVVEIAGLRYAVGSAAMVAILLWRRPPLPSRESLRANGLRSVLVVVTATSFFFALGRLPLAEVLILSFVSPTVTAILAAALLGERLNHRIAGAIATGFAGVAIIVLGGSGVKPGIVAASVGIDHLVGVAAVLVSAIGYSASNVLLRARARHDPVVTIVAIQNMAPAAMLAVPVAVAWSAPAGTDAALLVCVGLLGVAGHLLLAVAYARAEAIRLAPVDYTALIWAVGIGALVFGEWPTPAAWAGAILIVGSAALAARR